MAAPNWKSRTVWTADCLYILRGMNAESVDLIYLDPPFNSKADYAAPIGSKAAGAGFKDTWSLSDVDVEWINLIEAKHPPLHRVLLAAMTPSDKSYLVYMAARLLELRRVLKPTGSIYVHCDPTMAAYLKLVMDAVFGRGNFRNEITWHRSRGKGLNPSRYVQNCDRLLYYAMGKKWTWNQQYEAFEPGYGDDWPDDEFGPWDKGDLTGGKAGGPSAYMPFKGVLPASGRAWAPPIREKFPPVLQARLPADYQSLNQLEKCEALDAAGLIYWPAKAGGKPRYKKYLSTLKGRYVSDLVADIPPIGSHSKERTGYPTQKPLKLLERIIKASSNEGDVVLDPFCGCATTLVAAEALNRRWAGIDLSELAVKLVVGRLQQASDEEALFKGGRLPDVISRTDIPQRTDLGRLPAPTTHKKALYGEQGGHCAGCGTHFEARHLEVDHIISRAKGGTDHIENLQLLCGSCNRIKGDRGMEYLRTKLQLAPPANSIQSTYR